MLTSHLQMANVSQPTSLEMVGMPFIPPLLCLRCGKRTRHSTKAKPHFCLFLSFSAI